LSGGGSGAGRCGGSIGRTGRRGGIGLLTELWPLRCAFGGGDF
jgi:hypothetical protein